MPAGIKASLITVTIPLFMKYPSVSLAASCTLSLFMICAPSSDQNLFKTRAGVNKNMCIMNLEKCVPNLDIITDTCVFVNDGSFDVRVFPDTYGYTPFRR